LLLVGLATVGAVGWLVNSTVPTTLTIGVFFLLVFISVVVLMSFILNNKRVAALISLGAVMVLLLRLLGLRSPLYLVLLLVVMGSLELTWKKR
jgi:hypothetical protein